MGFKVKSTWIPGYKLCSDRADTDSIQQVWNNGEGRVGQPARQHCLHSAEASGMAAHAVCRHRYPGLLSHRPGLHWYRCRPVCHLTEHPSAGGMKNKATCLCFMLNPPPTCHPEPATLYWKRCGVSNKGGGVVSINNGGSCPFFTSWITRGKSCPPLASGALIQLSRTVFAIWNSALLPCSRLGPNAGGTFHDVGICWRYVFFNRGLCSFIMVCPTTSRTTGNMVCLKMTSSCMETWITSKWVKMARQHMYPSSIYYFPVFLSILLTADACTTAFIHSCCGTFQFRCVFLLKCYLCPHCWNYGQCPTLNLTHMPFCLVCPRAQVSTALPTSMTAMISPSYHVAP